MDTNENQTVTPDQIQAWKDEHGLVMKITVEDKVGYFRTPSRKAYSFASKVSSTDPLQFNEIILNDCFLGGNQDLIKHERYFLTMGTHVADLLGIMESSLEKL